MTSLLVFFFQYNPKPKHMNFNIIEDKENYIFFTFFETDSLNKLIY